MIKNIIFDLGNVLIKTDYEKILEDFSKNEEEKEFIINNILDSPELNKCGLINTGYITIEDTIKLINDRTNYKYEKLVENFLLNYIKYKTWNGDILDIIKKLKNNDYKVYLLSNISEYVFKEFKNELEHLLDGIVVSYEIHMIKPYNGIYEYIINKYNLKPEESLFIDDTEKNIETANKLGIKGRKVKPADIEDIKLVLKEYEVL